LGDGSGSRADQDEGGGEKEENEEAEVVVEVVVHGIHPAGDGQKESCIFVPEEEASSTKESVVRMCMDRAFSLSCGGT
jgi:hypothetical protein